LWQYLAAGPKPEAANENRVAEFFDPPVDVSLHRSAYGSQEKKLLSKMITRQNASRSVIAEIQNRSYARIEDRGFSAPGRKGKMSCRMIYC
jgi:hypothetical protein